MLVETHLLRLSDSFELACLDPLYQRTNILHLYFLNVNWSSIVMVLTLFNFLNYSLHYDVSHCNRLVFNSWVQDRLSFLVGYQ